MSPLSSILLKMGEESTFVPLSFIKGEGLGERVIDFSLSLFWCNKLHPTAEFISGSLLFPSPFLKERRVRGEGCFLITPPRNQRFRPSLKGRVEKKIDPETSSGWQVAVILNLLLISKSNFPFSIFHLTNSYLLINFTLINFFKTDCLIT